MDDQTRWQSTIEQVEGLSRNVRVYGQFTSQQHDPRYDRLADALKQVACTYKNAAPTSPVTRPKASKRISRR